MFTAWLEFATKLEEIGCNLMRILSGARFHVADEGIDPLFEQLLDASMETAGNLFGVRVEGGELPHLASYPEGGGLGTAIL